MKGLIVEDLTKEIETSGVSIAELETQIIGLMAQLEEFTPGITESLVNKVEVFLNKNK